jgi:hypothetical protein
MVVQVQGPSQMQRPPNLWKGATLFLLFTALLPVFLCLLVIRIGFWISFGLTSRHAGRRGDSAFSYFMHHRIAETFAPRHEPIPVYHYVIETPAKERISARQEGEFIDGRIEAGHQVTLRGKRRGGTLIISGGTNDTVKTTLTPPRDTWQVMFIIMLVLLGGLIAIAATMSTS